MDTYIWNAVNSTTVAHETALQRRQRFYSVRALWLHSNSNTIIVPPDTTRRLRHLSTVWVTWRRRVEAATTIQRRCRQWWRRLRPLPTRRRRRRHRRVAKLTQAIDAAIANEQRMDDVRSYPLTSPLDWSSIAEDFRMQVRERGWCGRVEAADVAHDMFYVLHTPSTAQRIVSVMISNSVTMDEMHSGRVWIRVCATQLDNITIELVRLHGGGLRPSITFGPRGILRVACTLRSNNRWSTPVWLNIGALHGIELYQMQLEKYIVSPSVWKLTSMLRDLQPPRQDFTLGRLVNLLQQGVTSETYIHCINTLFTTRWRMYTWWQLWRRSLPLRYGKDLRDLQRIVFTPDGTRMLIDTLESAHTRRVDLFCGRAYVRLEGGATDLRCVVEPASPRIAPATWAMTLGGRGPCCVAFKLDETFVWVNVVVLRFSRCSVKWPRIVYTFVMYELVIILQALRKWLFRWRRLKNLKIKTLVL